MDEVLIPLEVAAELAGGRLPDADRARVRDEARTRGLDGGNHPTELGGRGWTNLEQVLVHEELGRNTNAIWWNMARRLQRAVARHAGSRSTDIWRRRCGASGATPTR